MNIRRAIAKGRAIAAGKLARDEKGQILIIVLVFLVLGAIMITPLLGYMITGVRATGVYQRNNLELYAADAGVKDAMWSIQNVVTGLPRQPSDTALHYHPANVNDQPVSVTITRVSPATFKIVSLGGGPGNGTTVECYVNVLDFTDLLGNGVSSRESISIGNNTTVNGDVQAPVITNKGEINGILSNDPITNWPTAAMFATFYGKQVDKSSPYPWDTMLLPAETGPLYREGDLTISGTGTLTGTVYVTGDLDFEMNASVDLGGQTIFVEGNVDFRTHVGFIGIGCLIALGDINFMPNTNREGDFIFVMSVDHGVNYQPAGADKDSSFYGSVAGNQNVNFQPNCTLTHPEPPDLNLPGQSANIITGVEAWKVIPPMKQSLDITTGSLPDGQVNQPYSGTLAASGGTSPYTWSVTPGSLPDGLTLAPSTGAVTGTPTTAGTFSFTVQVADSSSPPDTATAAMSITVTGLHVDTSSLPDGYTDEPYSATLTAVVGTVPYTWSLASGSLPAGLTLTTVGNDGGISGTPTTAGTSSFTVRVTDSDSPSVTATKTLSITIQQRLMVATTSLANGWVGVAYSGTLTAGSGTPPYTWSVTVGSLPAGLTLTPSTGAITGTPTTAGTSSFTVRVTDGASLTAIKALSITIARPPAVTTLAATGVDNKSAILHGRLTDLGSAGGSVILYFQWGTDTSYSGGTVGAVPGSSSGPVPVNYNDTISGLKNNTTYHYRAYVVGSDGIGVYGLDQTFST
jgi:cytoskeletal protein CcmA (bactofilin family)